MKQLVIFILSVYKVVFSPLLHHFGGGCRHEETCSAYTTRQIKENGVGKGLVLGLKRFSTCHPFAK